MNDIFEQSGMNHFCSLCEKEITPEDFDKGNGAMRIRNIPGFVHAFCKVGFDENMIGTGTKTSLENNLKDLLGG